MEEGQLSFTEGILKFLLNPKHYSLVNTLWYNRGGSQGGAGGATAPPMIMLGGHRPPISKVYIHIKTAH